MYVTIKPPESGSSKAATILPPDWEQMSWEKQEGPSGDPNTLRLRVGKWRGAVALSGLPGSCDPGKMLQGGPKAECAALRGSTPRGSGHQDILQGHPSFLPPISREQFSLPHSCLINEASNLWCDCNHASLLRGPLRDVSVCVVLGFP